MNKKNIPTLILSTLISITAFAQSLSLKETVELERKIYHFLEANRPKSEEEEVVKKRPSEAFICLLTIDSTGKIGSVHLLSDEKNKGLGYTIFSKMAPESFGDWRCEKCMYKTIMIPINTEGWRTENQPKYVKDLAFSSALKPGEERNLIVVRRVNFTWPAVRY